MAGTTQALEPCAANPPGAGLVTCRRAVQASQIEIVEPEVPQWPHSAKRDKDSWAFASPVYTRYPMMLQLGGMLPQLTHSTAGTMWVKFLARGWMHTNTHTHTYTHTYIQIQMYNTHTVTSTHARTHTNVQNSHIHMHTHTHRQNTRTHILSCACTHICTPPHTCNIVPHTLLKQLIDKLALLTYWHWHNI